MATVAVSGSTGFVGSELCRALRAQDHVVRPLLRPESASADEEQGIEYTPGEPLDPAALAGCDAVIHLAGENLASGRWTAERKRRLRESRLASTGTLAGALAQLGERAPRWVSTSAVGFYGDRGGALVDERSGPGEGFLAQLCVEWEGATAEATARGVSVAIARLGPVVGPGGGMLAKLRPIFERGLGGRLGSGEQWLSWVSLQDAARALLFLSLGSSLEGPVNVCAPEPVTNATFTRALAEVLQRPARLPVPSPLARLALGEMADEALLAGQRVRPALLLEAGFHFEQPNLLDCLRPSLG